MRHAEAFFVRDSDDFFDRNKAADYRYMRRRIRIESKQTFTGGLLNKKVKKCERAVNGIFRKKP